MQLYRVNATGFSSTFNAFHDNKDIREDSDYVSIPDNKSRARPSVDLSGAW
jgi:hypothetical protein